MNKRLQQFLAAENISQAQFADSINVARASVSHILSGRNKPSFDFIESVMRHYPTINPDWLITGNGKMYNDHCGSDNLFEQPGIRKTPENNLPSGSDTLDNVIQQVKEETLTPKEKSISKIIVYYSDNTYTEIL